jgi:hypothetical protein
MFAGMLVFGGCAPVRHFDQLMVLKAVSNERLSQDEYVRSKDARFDDLLIKVCSGEVDIGTSNDDIQNLFGDPIGISFWNDEHDGNEEWVYRYQTRYFDASKVTLFFDPDDQLMAYEVSGCP